MQHADAIPPRYRVTRSTNEHLDLASNQPITVQWAYKKVGALAI